MCCDVLRCGVTCVRACVQGAYANTSSWVLVFIIGRSLAAWKQRSGSWLPLLLGPVLLRLLSAGWYHSGPSMAP